MARLAGIRVRNLTTLVYVGSGILSALAGIVLASRLDSSQPSPAEAGCGFRALELAREEIGFRNDPGKPNGKFPAL